MSSVNQATILGHLGRDPESRSFQNGGKVVTLRVATSEKWKDRTSGEQRDRTEWHTVSILNEGLANVAERYLRKGSKVYVQGTLATRKYTDSQGVERYSTEIQVRPFGGTLVLLDRREGDQGGAGNSTVDDRGAVATAGDDRGAGQPATGGFAADLDDDVPF